MKTKVLECLMCTMFDFVWGFSTFNSTWTKILVPFSLSSFYLPTQTSTQQPIKINYHRNRDTFHPKLDHVN